MIPDLPVWSVRPNWREGLTERLEWLTEVLASPTGAEQRIALRSVPRRYFEFTVNPTDGERTLLDLMLRRTSAGKWLLPLWHERAVIRTTSVDRRLDFDNRWREFVTGEWAVVYQSAFIYTVVEITGQDDDGLDIAEPVDAKRGTPVFPLRTAWQTDAGVTVSALTSRVGESQVGFMLERGDIHSADVTDFPMHEGLPVIAVEANRANGLDTTYENTYSETDSTVGLIYRASETDRSFANQSHTWQIVGRKDRQRMRRLLYAMNGQRDPVWLPTFNDDLLVVRPAAAGNQTLDVARCGLNLFGVPAPGRDLIYREGLILALDALAAPPDADRERVVLAQPLAAKVPSGAGFSFLEKVRLNQDLVEITHHVDSDGVMEIGAAFRAFADTRQTDGPLRLAIPAAEQTAGSCGLPGEVYVGLRNLGFEESFVGGGTWTGMSGRTGKSYDGTLPREGAFMATKVRSGGRAKQRIAVPPTLTARIDQGGVILRGYGGQHKSRTYPTIDSRLFVTFRDAAGVALAEVAGDYHAGDWTDVILQDSIIPVDTRFIDFGMDFRHNPGSEHDNLWDAMTPPRYIT